MNMTWYVAIELSSNLTCILPLQNIKNLCSAFSYCFTILGSIYIWHGRGSTTAERRAAMDYSKRLSNDIGSPTELVEGETDDDEMFWLILGDDDYAKADYWRWRADSTVTDPYVWKVNPENIELPVSVTNSCSHLRLKVALGGLYRVSFPGARHPLISFHCRCHMGAFCSCWKRYPPQRESHSVCSRSCTSGPIVYLFITQPADECCLCLQGVFARSGCNPSIRPHSSYNRPSFSNPHGSSSECS